MKTLILFLLPLSLTAKPYLGGSLALVTYTKTVQRSYTPMRQVEASYILKYAAAETMVTVPLDNNHPLAVALHAGVNIPFGRFSAMILAGPEYHYQELYKYPLDEKKTLRPAVNFSGIVRICMDNPFEEDNARVFVSLGYSVGMPVVGVGIVAKIGNKN